MHALVEKHGSSVAQCEVGGFPLHLDSRQERFSRLLIKVKHGES